MSTTNSRSLLFSTILGASALALSFALATSVNAQTKKQTENQIETEQQVQDIGEDNLDSDIQNDRGYGYGHRMGRGRGDGRGDGRGMGRGNYGHGMGMMGHRGMGQMMMGHGSMMGMGNQNLLERFDTNKDGRIEKEEFSKSLRTEYDQYNTSKDDKLTQEQFGKYWNDRHSERRVRTFQFLDRDGSNDISKEEFAFMTAHFDGFFDSSDEKGINLKNVMGGRGFGGWHKGMMGDMARDVLQEADANKDGYLAKSEVDTFLNAQFTKADTNKDGKLSQDELAIIAAQFTQPMQIRAFQRFDANGDNAISFAEFQKHQNFLFDRLDMNGDGVIEKSEFQRGHRMRGNGHFGKNGRDGNRGGWRGHGWGWNGGHRN